MKPSKPFRLEKAFRNFWWRSQSTIAKAAESRQYFPSLFHSFTLMHTHARTHTHAHAFTQTQCSFELTHSHSPFFFTHSFSPSLFLLLLLLACIHAQPFPSSSVTSFTEAKAPLPPLFYPPTRTLTHACTANHTHPHASTHISNTHLYTRTLSHTLASKHSHIYSVALSYPAILFVFFSSSFHYQSVCSILLAVCPQRVLISPWQIHCMTFKAGQWKKSLWPFAIIIGKILRQV